MKHFWLAFLIAAKPFAIIFFLHTSVFGMDSLRTSPTIPFQRPTKTINVTFSTVEITSSRISSTLERSITPTSILNTSQIRSLGVRQTAEVLSFTPSIFIRNYGGVGGLKTISLRGASASQTAIFIDGVRINSTQNGQFDFSGIPASLLEEVEVVRGGAGATFGAGAMAGAVNLRTLSRLTSPRLSILAEVASFEEYRASISGGIPLSQQGTIGILGHAEAQTAQGNFPFRFNEFGKDTVLERRNADAKLLSASLRGFAQLGRWHLQSSVIARFSERGTPGAVVQGNIEMAKARLNEQDIVASFLANNAFTHQSLFTMRVSGKWNTLLYLDPDARQFGINGINEQFLADDWSLSAKLRFEESVYAPFKQISHEWNLESSLSTLRGNMFQPGVGTRVQRSGIGFSAKSEAKIDIAKVAEVSQEIIINAAARIDNFNDVGGAFSPLFGVALLLDSIWTIRTSWTYNFRPPNFNELYYLNFGNTGLQPERAHCINVGTTYSIPASILTLSADAFFHRTHNQIIAVQTSPFTISAQNIEEAQTLGVETSIHAALWQNWAVRGNYTFQRVTNETSNSFAEGKQLIYTPAHLGSLLVQWQHDNISANASAQIVSDRYTLPSNVETSRLPAFCIVNINVESIWLLDTTKIILRLVSENILDTQYTVIRNFPMPSRSFRLSCSLNL